MSILGFTASGAGVLASGAGAAVASTVAFSAAIDAFAAAAAAAACLFLAFWLVAPAASSAFLDTGFPLGKAYR